MRVTKDEVAYLLRHLNHYLESPVTPEQIVSGIAGMRPLVSAGGKQVTSKLARDHEVELDEKSGLVSVMGGKWTTYRAMAEDTVDEVQRRPGKRRDTGEDGGSPAGRFGRLSPEYSKGLVEKFGIAEATARHLSLKFGTRATQVLELAGREPELR